MSGYSSPEKLQVLERLVVALAAATWRATDSSV